MRHGGRGEVGRGRAGWTMAEVREGVVVCAGFGGVGCGFILAGREGVAGGGNRFCLRGFFPDLLVGRALRGGKASGEDFLAGWALCGGRARGGGSWRGGLCAVGRSRVGTLGLAKRRPPVGVRKDVRGLKRKRGEGSFGRVAPVLALPPVASASSRVVSLHRCARPRCGHVESLSSRCGWEAGGTIPA